MAASSMVCRILFFAACLSVAANGQTAAEFKQQADARKASGDAAGALEFMEKAAEADPNSAGLEDEIGFLLAVLKRNPEAKLYFERAIQLDPSFAAAHYHLGVLFWLEKDPNRAIPLFQTAVKLAPGVFDYHLKLGLAFFGVSHYQESVTELEIATKLDPGNASAWNSLGLSLQQTGARGKHPTRTPKPSS
jgi:tetratricopeptide (TPR) repeat protein